ncbi:hypothetical protein DOY81_004948 [Sarcophaga bullata]|nr:hypothetical protein DOY81_004948 [Sarcophaga bullata]
MCVMDSIQGTFYNIKEMLAVITNIKISTEDKIAMRVCNTCFNKITSFYNFILQVRKAEQILKRMASKLKDEKSCPSTGIKKEGKRDIEIRKPEIGNTEESIIIEVEELFGYIPDMENAMEIDANIIEDNYIANNTEIFENANSVEEEGRGGINSGVEVNNDTLESKTSFECLEELFQEGYEIFASEQNNENESIFEKQSQEVESLKEPADVNRNNEDIVSQADSFEEVFVTDSEYLDDDSKQSKSKDSSLNPEQESSNFKPRKSKHRQPRLELPLLEELKCRFCDQIFERQSDFVDHVQDEHPSSKAFKCRYCNSAFAHVQSLSRHVNKHKKHLVKYTCEYCYREFMRADDLKRHIRTHTGERPYPCAYCDKSFKQHGEMKSHEDTHLPKKVFSCELCPKTFTSRNGLYLHKRTHNKTAAVSRKTRNLKTKKREKKEKKENERILQFSSDEGE